jgi:hypothetical protein
MKSKSLVLLSKCFNFALGNDKVLDKDCFIKRKRYEKD